MNADARWQFRIDRTDIRRAELVEVEPRPLEDGDVEVRLRRFALTANNMTYALLGNGYVASVAAPGYFEYFPTTEGKGLLPVWGIAEVSASRCDDLAVGVPLYGFLPLASHWVLSPGAVEAHSFRDETARRSELPAVYNHYTLVGETGDFEPRDSHLWVVFRPLLRTGYLIADALRSQAYHSAARVLFLSASSKTAMITAHCLRRMQGCPRLIAATSKRNAAFVTDTGLYDDVLEYRELDALDAEGGSTAIIDLAADGELTKRLRARLGDALCHYLIVGKSHWNAPAPERHVGDPAPEFFFAPAAIAERVRDWGLAEVRRRFAAAWSSFLPEARRFVEVHIGHGRYVVPDLYEALREGRLDPRNPQLVELD